MTRDGGDGRVDDLRRQLRSLGYLDAGVDRFVLGSARGARSPATVAGLGSIRVGLLAAILLGPAAAVGVASRLSGLVTGPRDAIVVALYLAVIFGLVLSGLTFLVSTLVARVVAGGSALRGRWISRGAGTLTTIACLTYLTLWWRGANAGLAWAAPVWTVFAIAVAVAISLLLGHAVSITTFAVMAARGWSAAPFIAESQPAVGRGSRSTWRLVLIAGIVAFAGAATLLIFTAPAADPQDQRPPLAIVSPGLRLKVVAIDGFDPEVFESLRVAGRVPVLTRLFAGGVARFAPDETRDPARAWTTIATGQSAEVHGVRGLETRRVAGLQGVLSPSTGSVARALNVTTDLLRLTRPSIASGGELRTKPFWEVASDAGLRAAVVNWWATWPAAGSGSAGPLVISDRATLRLERGGALDGEIAPKEFYDRLRPEWPALVAEAKRTASAPVFAPGDDIATSALRRSAELDALQIGLCRRLPQPLDLVAVYLPGLDVVQHTLLGAGGSAASTVSARVDYVRAYYAYLDSLLEDFTRSSPEEIVVVVTHPGRLTSLSRGMFAMSGGIAGPGVSIDARAVDLAPTLLHALGIPVSRELAGAPIDRVFLPSFMARFPVRDVPTYGARPTVLSTGRGDPLDAEALERLRSLGYVR